MAVGRAAPGIKGSISAPLARFPAVLHWIIREVLRDYEKRAATRGCRRALGRRRSNLTTAVMPLRPSLAPFLSQSLLFPGSVHKMVSDLSTSTCRREFFVVSSRRAATPAEKNRFLFFGTSEKNPGYYS